MAQCITTSEPTFSNRFGLERHSSVGRSVAPLKAINGVAFATLVSGPPSVPDELLETLCNQAGPLLERVWKEEKACEAVGVVTEFIKQSALSHHQLIYAKFEKGAEHGVRNADREAWEWQALEQ